MLYYKAQRLKVYISLRIIFCIIEYVTNKRTLNLEVTSFGEVGENVVHHRYLKLQPLQTYKNRNMGHIVLKDNN